MNGQGTSNQQDFPRPQRPRFNFNSRDVKKELTSDFMAAQLASFGSSAKLKPMPVPQTPSNQQTFPNHPGQFTGHGSGFPASQIVSQQTMFSNQTGQFATGYSTGFSPAFSQQQTGFNQSPQMVGYFPGYPQMNQGYRQPMSSTQIPQQNPVNLSQTQQLRFSSQHNSKSTGIGTNSFVPAQGNLHQFPQTNTLPLQQNSTSQAQPAFQKPGTIQSSARSHGTNDMFASFSSTNVSSSTAAEMVDPFSNLRSSSVQQNTVAVSNLSTSHSGKTTDNMSFLGPVPFVSDTNLSQKPFGDFATFSTSSASAVAPKASDNLFSNNSNADITALSGFSPSLSSTSSGSHVPSSNVFGSASSTVVDNNFTLPQQPVQSENLFNSTQSQIQPASSFVTDLTSTPSLSSGKPLDLFDSTPFTSVVNKPSSNQTEQSNTNFVSMSNSSKQESSQYKSDPGLNAIFGPSFDSPSNLESSLQIKATKPETVSSMSFNAFEDNFNAPITISDGKASQQSKNSRSGSYLGDSFGLTPFENTLNEGNKTLSSPSSAVGLFEAPESSVKDISQTLDLFGSAPFSSDSNSVTSAKPLQYHSSAVVPPASQSTADKYSVFDVLQDTTSSVTTDSSNFAAFSNTDKIKITESIQAVTPVAPFHQSSMFDDAFDPFNTKSYNSTVSKMPDAPEQFDMFDSLSSTSVTKLPPVPSHPTSSQSGTIPQPTNETASVVRKRPTAKASEGMVMLPPPTTERKRPPSASKAPQLPLTRPSTQITTELLVPPTTQPANQQSLTTSQPTSQASLTTSQPTHTSDLFSCDTTGFTDLFDPFSTANTVTETTGGLTDIFSMETDGAVFGKPGRPVQPKEQKPLKNNQVSQKSRTKRPAPKPPSRGNQGSTFYSPKPPEVSLLDVDFTMTSDPVPATNSQPLLILPSPGTNKRAPPARPPPPKTGDSPQDLDSVSPQVSSLLKSGPPPLPPRPGPGHQLYNYMVQSGPYAVALFQFEAEIEDELDFKVGDVIKLESDVSDEWYSGSIALDHGIFPKNLVDVKIPLPTSSASDISSPSPDLPPSINWGTPRLTPPSQPSPDLFNAWGDTRTPSPPLLETVLDSGYKSPQETTIPSPDFTTSPTITSTSPPPPATATSPSPPATTSPVTQESPEPQVVTVLDTCTVIYSFEAQELDELDVTEGDIVDVLEIVDDDWIRGRLGDKVGIFPRGFAALSDEEIPAPLEDVVDDATHSVNVLYDFEAGAPDELSLIAGDMVQVIALMGEEWVKGRCGEKEGIFPASFVPHIPSHWDLPDVTDPSAENFETTDDSSSSSSDDESDVMSEISEDVGSNNPGERLGQVQVVADFDAQNDFEMSVKAGDVVTVTAKLNELWLEGECDGHVGILPSNFVKWLDAPSDSTDILANPAFDSESGIQGDETLTSSDKPTDLSTSDEPLDLSVSPDIGVVSGELSSLLKETIPTDQSADCSLTGTPFSESNPFADILEPDAKTPTSTVTPSNVTWSDESRDKTTWSDASRDQFAWPGHVTSQADVSSPSQDELDKTLVSPDNPFTEDIMASGEFKALTDPIIKPGTKLRTLYAFDPENDDELSFQQGDIIEVTEFLNEDWLRGKLVQSPGEEGVFPSSYAQKID